MARRRTKRRRKTANAFENGSKSVGLPVKRIFQVGLAVMAGIGGWVVWQSLQSEEAFQRLSEAGRSALSQVKTEASFGSGHLSPGQTERYRGRFPTSGRHSVATVEPGFYPAPQAPTRLVHSLEHGHVVVYYDTPGGGVLDTLKSWSSLYVGSWSGLVAVRSPGLGNGVVLTAWRKILRLESFQKESAAAFIDMYRGRGPEKRVR